MRIVREQVNQVGDRLEVFHEEIKGRKVTVMQ